MDLDSAEDVVMAFAGDGKHKFKTKVLEFHTGEHAMKGHAKVIEKLIENGSFSQEELDQIQSALDAKR